MIGTRSIPAWAGETDASATGRRPRPVYPRVGGGNSIWRVLDENANGLSPRGRGKRGAPTRAQVKIGSIPAWAGETAHAHARICAAPVYPRVGGGNCVCVALPLAIAGLSPRGRGKRAAYLHRQARERSIPAWAGETRPKASRREARAVYPRVGGGNTRTSAYTSSPKGLSPRGRGKPLFSPRKRRRRRSIPAWAGETQRRARRSANRGVYPRVGGGNVSASSVMLYSVGLSPRGRGKPPGLA